MNDPDQKIAFLDFCHTFDRNPYVCGMGKNNLFAKGKIESNKMSILILRINIAFISSHLPYLRNIMPLHAVLHCNV